MANGDLAQTGQVDEAGRTDVVAVRVGGAVRNQIEADLALGALDARVGLALGWLEHLRHLGADVTLGDRVERLLQDPRALSHLLDADHVAIEAVPVVAHGDVPIEAIVDRIGLGPPHVVVDAAGAQDRTRHAVRPRHLGRDHADVDRSISEDFVGAEDRFVLVDLRREDPQEPLQLRKELRRRIARDSAIADVRRIHADARRQRQEVEHRLAFAERIQQRCAVGADVHAEGSDRHQVALDAAQLAGDHPQVLGSLWHDQAAQALDCQRVGPIGGDRRQVVHAVRQDGALHVGAHFAQLFRGAVQIAHDGYGRDDCLTLELHNQAEHAVGAGVLRAQVEGDQVFLIDDPELARLLEDGVAQLRTKRRPEPRNQRVDHYGAFCLLSESGRVLSPTRERAALR